MSNPNNNANAAAQEEDDAEMPSGAALNDAALDNVVFAAAYQSDESSVDALDQAIQAEEEAEAQNVGNSLEAGAEVEVEAEADAEPEPDGEGEGEGAAAAEDDSVADDAGNANADDDPAADRRSATKKELTQIIDKWEQEQTQNGYDPVPTLRR